MVVALAMRITGRFESDILHHLRGTLMKSLFIGLLMLSFAFEAAALWLSDGETFGRQEWSVFAGLLILGIVILWMVIRGKLFSTRGKWVWQNYDGTIEVAANDAGTTSDSH